MDGALTQVGVGGIFALLVIREVLGFVKSRNNKKTPELPLVRVKEVPQFCHDSLREIAQTCTASKEIAENTLIYSKDTFAMHNVRDSQGQLVWYNGPVAEGMRELTETVRTQTVTLRELLTELLVAVKANGKRQ